MIENRGNDKRYDYRDSYATRLIVSAIAFAVFLIMFCLYSSGKSLEFDLEAGEAIRALRVPPLDLFLTHITFMGKWTTIVTIGVLLLIADAVRWKKYDYPLALAASLLNFVLYALLKRTICRPRPDEVFWMIEESGFSFPSGHSMNGTFCYGIMLYLLIRNCGNRTVRNILTVVLCVLIPLICFSRPYLGVHHPTDVIAGFSLGLSMLMIATVAIDEILLRVNAEYYSN